MGLFGNLLGKRRRYDDEENRQPFDERAPWSTYDPSNMQDFPAQRETPQRSGGIFGDGDTMEKLLRAYALAKGDVGSAASINAMMAKPRAAAAKRQQDREDYLWQQQNKAPSGDEYATTEDNAGNVWRYNKRTGQVDPKPIFVDQTPRYYVQGDQAVRIPNRFDQTGKPAMGSTVDAGDIFGTPQSNATLPSGKSWDALDRLEPSPEQVRQNYIGVMGRVAGERQFQEWLRENRRRGGR